MKLSKDELKQKVNELVTDNDISITLLEDIEDSFEVDRTEIEELQAKFDELQEKYKQRFLKGDDKKDPEDKKEVDEELEEKEVIDIKEI